jgi:magnesium transporter
METDFVKSLRTVESDGFKWIDLPKPTRREMDALGRLYSFHDLNLEDSLSKIQLPKVERHTNYIFVIVHFPSLGKERHVPRVSQLSMFLGANFLVTVHQGELEPLMDLFRMCQENPSQRENLMGKEPGYLLHTIIDTLVDDLFHILMKVVGNIDDIEEGVFNEKMSEAREISILRREITILRRLVLPMRRIVIELSRDVQRFSKEDLTPYFYDVKEHIEKVLETLDESKETIEIYKDTDFMLSSEKSNRILSILTILFTLSIPVTIISTFYGMNLPLPGDNNNPALAIFGSYTTLIILLIGAVTSTTLLLWYFRREGWISIGIHRHMH